MYLNVKTYYHVSFMVSFVPYDTASIISIIKDMSMINIMRLIRFKFDSSKTLLYILTSVVLESKRKLEAVLQKNMID